MKLQNVGRFMTGKNPGRLLDLLTQQLHGMTDAQYDMQIIKHKEIIKEMILNYLFPKKSTNE